MKRDFSEFIGELNGGAFASDCAERLEEVVKAATETGKPGSILIEIKVQSHDDGTASVSTSLKTKTPSKGRAPSTFFVHEDALHRDHPNQQPLSLSNVRSITSERPTNVREA